MVCGDVAVVVTPFGRRFTLPFDVDRLFCCQGELAADYWNCNWIVMITPPTHPHPRSKAPLSIQSKWSEKKVHKSKRPLQLTQTSRFASWKFEVTFAFLFNSVHLFWNEINLKNDLFFSILNRLNWLRIYWIDFERILRNWWVVSSQSTFAWGNFDKSTRNPLVCRCSWAEATYCFFWITIEDWRTIKIAQKMDDLNPLAGTAHLLEEVDSECVVFCESVFAGHNPLITHPLSVEFQKNWWSCCETVVHWLDICEVWINSRIWYCTKQSRGFTWVMNTVTFLGGFS